MFLLSLGLDKIRNVLCKPLIYRRHIVIAFSARSSRVSFPCDYSSSLRHGVLKLHIHTSYKKYATANGRVVLAAVGTTAAQVTLPFSYVAHTVTGNIPQRTLLSGTHQGTYGVCGAFCITQTDRSDVILVMNPDIRVIRKHRTQRINI